MMSAPCDSASAIAIADFPAAVGPQMMRTLLSSETSLELIPRDLHDRRPAVHVVCGQRRRCESDEQRLHLAERELIARLDGGLARDRRGKPFVTRRGTRQPVAGERVER